jgi:gluconate 2-dehydrogenase gamma chain
MKSRRTFIQQLVAAGIIINLPLALSSCQNSKIVIEQNVLSQNQLEIANYIFMQLFPKDDDSINAKSLATLQHFISILSDSNYDKTDKNYLIQGLDWTEETAQEHYKESFLTISNKEKQALFNTLLQEKWGKSWLSYMLDCTFESLLIDSIYQVNPNEIGWKWLNHQAGNPRPNSANFYSKIIARKKENIIITNINQL